MPNESNTTIIAPAGVTIGPGVQTSKVVNGNSVENGIQFPITLDDGTKASFFVPYSQLNNLPAIEASLNNLVAGIRAITQASS